MLMESTGSSICDTSVSFKPGSFQDCCGQKCNLNCRPWERTVWQMPSTKPAVRCDGQSRVVLRNKGAFFLPFSVSDAYLHSPETEYRITDCTWSFYETRQKQGRYLTAEQILLLINSVPPKSSFPCWQVSCAWNMPTLTVVASYRFKWMLDLTSLQVEDESENRADDFQQNASRCSVDFKDQKLVTCDRRDLSKDLNLNGV